MSFRGEFAHGSAVLNTGMDAQPSHGICLVPNGEKPINAQRPTPNAQRPLSAAKIAPTFENQSPRIGRWELGVGSWALNAGCSRTIEILNVHSQSA